MFLKYAVYTHAIVPPPIHHTGVLWAIFKVSAPSATLLVFILQQIKIKAAFSPQNTLDPNHYQKCVFSWVPFSSLGPNPHQLALRLHTQLM